MMKERKLLALLGAVLLAGCGGTKTEPTVEITTDASTDGATPDTGPLEIPDAGSRVPGPNDPIPCAIDQCVTGPKRCATDGTAVLTPTKGTCVDGFCAFEYAREECLGSFRCSSGSPVRCSDDWIVR